MTWLIKINKKLRPNNTMPWILTSFSPELLFAFSFIKLFFSCRTQMNMKFCFSLCRLLALGCTCVKFQQRHRFFTLYLVMEFWQSLVSNILLEKFIYFLKCPFPNQLLFSYLLMDGYNKHKCSEDMLCLKFHYSEWEKNKAITLASQNVNNSCSDCSFIFLWLKWF